LPAGKLHLRKRSLCEIRSRPLHSADFIALVEKHRIPYHEKTLGQLFCDRAAEDITNMLEAECRAAGVQIFLNCRVQEVQRTTQFIVRTEAAEFHTSTLVVATGGLSIPKMGATAFGYDLARQFGFNIINTKPGLVPFLLGGKDYKLYSDLAGVSTEVIASANHHAFREKMLITHRGLSGPAILQISSYWDKDSPSKSIWPRIAKSRRRFARQRCVTVPPPSRLPGNPAETLRRTLARSQRSAKLDQRLLGATRAAHA